MGVFQKGGYCRYAALIVDAVYADVTGANGIALFIATFFFAVQIYADFSGYSDIAVGAARVLGYDLIINFRSPYFSRSISEFWRRWHISLMRWFKEYIYIPIGGNRVSSSGWIRNILIVFFVSGLWHGANWTFVVWGLINAFYIIFEKYTLGIRTTFANITGLARHRLLYSSSQIITTFSLTLIAWVFFRAVSIHEAFFVFKRVGSEALTIISDPSTFYPLLMSAGYSLNISKENLIALIVALLVLLMVDIVAERAKWSDILMRLPQSVRWGLYYTVIFYIILAGNYGQNAFIYFQF